MTDAFQDYLYNGLLFAGAAFCLWRAAAVREERLAWALMGAGIVSWTAADIVWTVVYADDPNAPYPSVADALWLAWYPASYVVLVLLVRSRFASVRASLWLDGVIGAVTRAWRSPSPWPTSRSSAPLRATWPRWPPTWPTRWRHDPAGRDRRDLRRLGLAARPGLDRARRRPRAQRARRRDLPRPDRRGHLRRGLAARRLLAGLVPARRPGGLAAGQARRRPRGGGPARGADALRLRPGRASRCWPTTTSTASPPPLWRSRRPRCCSCSPARRSCSTTTSA